MLPQAVQSGGSELALAGVDQWGVLGLQGVERLGRELLKVLGIQNLQGEKLRGQWDWQLLLFFLLQS